MKRYAYFLASVGALLVFFGATPVVSAQPMMNNGLDTNTSSGNTAASGTTSEQQGQNVYDQLQNKQTTCNRLTDADFANLGDFYMSEMMGSAHDVMDQYMSQQLGASGDRQAHIAIGKRLSGCDVNATYPSSANNYAPLAWMGGMMGNDNGSSWGWDMMNGYNNSIWNVTDTILLILLVIAVATALFVWLRSRSRTTDSPLAILKTRYAKGEINKDEYERIKKSLK